MHTLDAINARMGAGTLRFAAGGIKPTWGMRRQRLSPTSTTRIADLPQAWAL
jgi:DNA polymerase V